MHRVITKLKAVGKWIRLHFFTKSELINGDQVRIVPKGHSVFKYNVGTRVLTLAVCQMLDGKKTVQMQKGCLYVSALNRDNAIKKLAKAKLKVTPGEKSPQIKQPAGDTVYFKKPKEEAKK